MEVRPIDANALGNYEIEISKDIMKCNPDIKEIFAIFGVAIDRQPTLDYEPVVHAHWIGITDGTELQLACSHCHYDYVEADPDCTERHNYCPNCGAKMDEEVKG